MHRLKRIISISIMFIGIGILCSCVKMGTTIKTEAQKIDSKMSSIKSYEADVCINFIKSGETHTIKMKQNYEMGKSYTATLIEPERLKGYCVKWDGEKVQQYNPITGETVEGKASAMQNELLFGSFVNHYKETKDIECKGEKLEEKDCLTVKLIIPGNYKYLAKEKVWFDKDTLTPIQMEIYSEEDEKTIDIKFERFKIKA